MNRAQDQLEYPQFHWPAPGSWFTVVGALAGLALLVFPGMAKLSTNGRLVIFVLLVSAPAVVILVIHLNMILYFWF